MRPRSFRGRRCRGHEPTQVTAGLSAARSVYPTSPVRGNRPAGEGIGAGRHTDRKPVDSAVPDGGRLSGENLCSWSDSQEVVTVAGAVRNGQRTNMQRANI